MWVILLEAAVALSLLLIIVWATWPRKGSDGSKAAEPEQDKDE